MGHPSTPPSLLQLPLHFRSGWKEPLFLWNLHAHWWVPCYSQPPATPSTTAPSRFRFQSSEKRQKQTHKQTKQMNKQTKKTQNKENELGPSFKPRFKDPFPWIATLPVFLMELEPQEILFLLSLWKGAFFLLANQLAKPSVNQTVTAFHLFSSGCESVPCSTQEESVTQCKLDLIWQRRYADVAAISISSPGTELHPLATWLFGLNVFNYCPFLPCPEKKMINPCDMSLLPGEGESLRRIKDYLNPIMLQEKEVKMMKKVRRRDGGCS